MRRYKDTWVAKGSALSELMQLKTPEGKKAAEAMYNQTTASYKARYSEEDRAYFAVHQQVSFANRVKEEVAQ